MLSMLITLIVIIFDIFAIADILKSNRDTATKVILIVLILMFPIIGAGVYWLVFRDKGWR
ncbi:MAG TPA: PLDc N-terminal domain-containing protein [Blastocatellia bacterium]|nr:PLDc N-terminal domain-containing protein [Blastocatellia bacterium]